MPRGLVPLPIASLSTRPDRAPHTVTEWGVEVASGPTGRATIRDQDVLIYGVSQVFAAMKDGASMGSVLTCTAQDLLTWTGRETSGDAYRRLREACERLLHTKVSLTRGGVTRISPLLNAYEMVRKTRGGRMVSMRMQLSDWHYHAACNGAIMPLDPAYFTLRRPLERRLCELATHYCDGGKVWEVSVDALHRQSGSTSPRRVFRALVREAIAANPLPRFDLAELPGDRVRLSPKG